VVTNLLVAPQTRTPTVVTQFVLFLDPLRNRLFYRPLLRLLHQLFLRLTDRAAVERTATDRTALNVVVGCIPQAPELCLPLLVLCVQQEATRHRMHVLVSLIRLLCRHSRRPQNPRRSPLRRCQPISLPRFRLRNPLLRLHQHLPSLIALVELSPRTVTALLAQLEHI